MKPPMTALHRLGHIASNYIDDLILQGRTYTDCVQNVIDTVSQLDPLGFVIHPDKSVFIPTQVLVVLGFVINTVTMTIYLTTEKGNFDRPMTLSASAKNELSRWVTNILSACNRISHPSPLLIITSDASHVGWGAACDDTSTRGTWLAKETQSHINYLELLAAIFFPENICKKLYG